MIRAMCASNTSAIIAATVLVRCDLSIPDKQLAVVFIKGH
jgi:hypothetical protein